MVITLKVLCEQIERILKGTFGGDRTVPTRNEIAIHIRQGIGYVMKGEVFDNFKIDGQFFTNDEYNFVIQGLTLTAHDDVKSVTLPVLPINMPKGRGVVAVTPKGYLSTGIIPVQRKDLDLIIRNSRLKCDKKLVYIIENRSLVFIALGDAVYPSKVDVTVAYAPLGGMDEELTLSDDMQANIIRYVLSVYGSAVKAQEDVNTDGINLV